MRTLLAFLALAAAAGAEPVVLRSPDGRVEIAFDAVAKDGGTGTPLTYSVSFRGHPLLEASALRLDLQGQRPLGTDVRIVSAATSTVDETYRPVTGKTSQVRNHAHALRLDLEETVSDRLPARRLTIEARAYDDAVAFRYVVPEQGALRELRLAREGTEFRLAKDATTYALVLPNDHSMYESEFLKLPASAFSNQGGVSSTALIGCPLLLDMPGVAWAAITEADVRDTAAMYLVNPSGSWLGHWFASRLSPDPADPEVAVTGVLPYRSAWRVVLVGDTPGRLMESNVVQALNPEAVVKDTSWIKPGRSSWDWWSGSLGPDGKKAFTTENMKYYVDFSARSGFEYMLVDSGWSPRDDITKMNSKVDIPELVRYGAAKNVKIWIWAHWSPVDRQLEEAFPIFEKWGVAGVKIDFMSRDDQRMMRWYYRVAAAAAEHHLMVDFHGSTKPSGMERMYPNVVGYEAVLGMEQSKAGARDNPDSHVMLPFTRMLVGPMDYTPGGFENVTAAAFVPRMDAPMVMGTRAHHLAMYVVFEAAIQMVSDHPAAYEGQPGFEFIKGVPTSWDEMRVVDGVPGEHVTVARRRGQEWYLGSLTGWSARSLDIPLDFLGKGSYTAEIYADAPDAAQAPKHVAIEKRRVSGAARLKPALAPGGGYAVRFRPVP
jgi:alpha-glucosidase